jgi:hypothetical protein
MKKAVIILLGLALALGILSACGRSPEEKGGPAPAAAQTGNPETVAASENSGNTRETEEPSETVPDETGSVAETSTLAGQEEDALPGDKIEAIALYAAAVDKALAGNRQVVKTTNMRAKRPFDGDDGAIRLLSASIIGINVEAAICEGLNEGTRVYTEPTRDAMQRCALLESDVTGFTAEKNAQGNTALTLNIKDCRDPLQFRDGGSPIGRFTWDFPDVAATYESFKGVEDAVPGLRIKIDKITYRYTDIIIKAVIRPDGSFAALDYYFKYTLRMEGILVTEIGIKVAGGGGEWGQGSADCDVNYKF